ncbi:MULTISPECIES: ABC transporter ATP-binding protein [unclassified Paenibacillus]|uniref:ATP-binding cassette domain-containing protein n=1 Tax=unclassified Paenibacillus TaxID=185978 RepID=UPI0003E1E45D|nr:MULTISPECIES: ABC transporter ATP-binding protein [unclassified Paenibacillus]ETT56234.1 ABC transporter ATP-binding protein [Paenibacillus sp. FSL R7-269]OMG00921.1 multidrug ABC transporter ATP-binding protein [Paenibacillus sp. FSL R7-0337]
MIELEHVSQRYAYKKVLKDVTFTAEMGQITCLIGLNGVGKSTILKAIMGLTPIHGGSIRIEGKPLNRNTYERVSYIPDHLSIPASMKLADALRFMEDFYCSWNKDRADELMRFFDLDFQERIRRLSKGTAAKFNLVLGLAQDSDYVIMDEPFSGIDLISRERIAEVFSSEMVGSRGVLLTTHEVGEIEHLIDKAVLLRDGTVARSFECEQLRIEENKSVVDVMKEVYLA